MKVGVLITARLKSSRLPLKLLQDLKGRTIVERVIDRCKNISGVDEVVLCTSVNPQDKPLVDTALKNQTFYFLGSEEDVLKDFMTLRNFSIWTISFQLQEKTPCFQFIMPIRLLIQLRVASQILLWSMVFQ